ncbi:MAG: hypothetical protein HS113_05740 [Verrucomicrobiales bacterium]|nr:hypothetical protein [Verrucomicrobiales bacterium]
MGPVILGVFALGTACSPLKESPASAHPAAVAPDGVAPAKPAAPRPAGPPAPEPRYPVLTPITPVQGRVVFLNAKLRFVIVDFTFHQLPQAGQRLGLYRGTARVGEVRVSGPFRGQTTVADVMSGEARVGDQVRED